MLKQLKVYYLFVTLPFALLLIGSTVFFDAIKSTIIRNPHPQINYTIFVIIIVGGVLITFNARRLIQEAKALVAFSGAIREKVNQAILQKMANGFTCDIACILQMLAASGDRSISHQEQAALEHELENARSRLVRRNALPQYLTGLLVGMGLLGTFIGLLATLSDISALIGSFADLDMSTADPLVVFRNMIERMKAPMVSMAIAFSASMFGLLGSIILGLMMVGIRRLQGDIFSLLNSQVARHIEVALSFESLSFRGGEVAGGGTGDLTTKILLRIEERLAEAARLRQRALSSEIDDFKTQRADMLRALTEQTEASNNFRGELQHLGRQLGTVFQSLEKNSGGISTQLSHLTVHLAGDAKETHKLAAMQVEEQQKLRKTLDSYKIEERFAEVARLHQRAVSAEMDDFQKQRAEMMRTLTEQTEASNNFRAELQHLGRQLGTIFQGMEKGRGEISAQISELTVHLGAEAKQSHRLLNNGTNTVRSELQQLGSQLVTISNVLEQGNHDLANQLQELGLRRADDAKGSQEQRVEMLRTLTAQLEASHRFREELQQLGGQFDNQLGTISTVMLNGNGELATQVSELAVHTTGEAKKSQDQRADMLRSLTAQIEASQNFRNDLHQLGEQLGNIFHAMEKGNNDLATQISELMGHRAADARESHKLLALLVHEQDPQPSTEQLA